MKSYIIKLLLLIIVWSSAALFINAQDGGFNYQAALRSASGEVLANQSVRLRVTIEQAGDSFFSEDHITETNEFGILNLAIGHGNASGSLADVPWGSPGLSLSVELDEGTGFRLLGNAPLMPVPYAMFAGEAENTNAVEDIQINEEGDLQIFLTDQTVLNAGNVLGPQGDEGPAGPQGEPGIQGPQGEQGLAGKDGTGVTIIGSVPTEIDLDTDHDGSEGDMVIIENTGIGFVWDGSIWVEVGSIQGPIGPPGPQGSQGEQGVAGTTGPVGPQGPEGVQGPTGVQGPDGAEGPSGPKGDPGQDGTGVQIIGSVPDETDLDPNHPGSVGDMVLVETTGEGFVWDGSVWVKVGSIQGPAGPVGPQGPQGPQGTEGPAGVAGLQGPSGDEGPQGIQGLPGPEGDQGDPGIQGEKGDPGATGPKGDQGDQGLPGPKGDKGDKGDQGEKGDQGTSITGATITPAGVLILSHDDPIQDPFTAGDVVGPQGLQGDKGNKGDQGDAGADGTDGLHCWDLDGDGLQDANEDINNDGKFDALDCKGPKGDRGSPGSGGSNILSFGAISQSAKELFGGSGNWSVSTNGSTVVITVSGSSLSEKSCTVLISQIESDREPHLSFKDGKIQVTFSSATAFGFLVLTK